MNSHAFQDLVQRKTHCTIEQLREMPLDESRRRVESRLGRRLVFSSNWPFIGRGSVMQRRTLSRDEVEACVDEALAS